MGKPTPGAKVVGRTVDYKDWVGGQNALKYATREQVVAFANLQLREQIVPLIRNAIVRYDHEVRQRTWWRRLLRWVFRRRLERTAQEQVREILADQAAEDAAVVGGIGRPEDNGEVRRTCVVCGSVQLEPVNERGGLKCDNGHVLEDPPTEVPDRDTGRGPQGSPGGPT